MRRMSTILFAFLCSANAVCQSRTTAIPDFDPNGKMVFVEDYDGEGGLLSFNFGDIVIFDPVTKQKTRITHDKYCDLHPSWSPDGQKIIFESIRMDSPGKKGRWRIIDLSDPTHLFIFDIRTGQLTQFDKDFVKIYGIQVGEQNEKPAWSPISNQIAFVTKIDGFREKLVVLDLGNNTVTSLTTPKQFEFYGRILWSPKGEHLAFDIFIPHSKGNTGIVVMNIKSKEAKLVSDVSKSCGLGGWTPDGTKLIFDYYHESKIKESGFYEYSLETGKITLLKQFKDVVCGDGQIGANGNVIAFTRYDWSTHSYDIWLYNMSDGSCSQLTTDGHEKDGLMWYVKP